MLKVEIGGDAQSSGENISVLDSVTGEYYKPQTLFNVSTVQAM